MAWGFSPRDEELAFLPGPLTPGLHVSLVRLGSAMPFARAARLFAHFRHVTVSASTARRLTERAGQAVFGADTAGCTAWITTQLHELKWGQAARVVAAVQALPTARCTAEAQAVVGESIGSLTKRLAHMQSARFRALGYPIGSGSVESGHKVVTRARLAGAGMQWARGQVNGLCALGTVERNDRWEEAWPQVVRRVRDDQRHAVHARATLRRAALAPALGSATVLPATLPRPASAPRPTSPPHHPAWRPAPDHPWRRAYRPTTATSPRRAEI